MVVERGGGGGAWGLRSYSIGLKDVLLSLCLRGARAWLVARPAGRAAGLRPLRCRRSQMKPSASGPDARLTPTQVGVGSVGSR